jgi:hypothetical protein
MNKKSLVLCLVAFIAFSGISKAQELERRSIGNVNKLIINGASDVFLNLGNEASISASSDNFRQLNYEIDGTQLILNSGGADAVYLQVVDINEIILTGSGILMSSDTLRGNYLKITASGAGSIQLIAINTKTELEIEGSVDITLKGRTEELKAQISGAGDLNAYNFEASKAEINLSGAGDAKIYASNEIRGKVSGAGTLYHQGNPEVLEVEVSGLGEVKKSNNLSASDTTRIKFGNKKIIILDNDDQSRDIEIGDDIMIDGEIKNALKPKKPEMPSIWAGFELGVNGYLNTDNTLNMDSVNSAWELNYGKSIAVNFNLWEKSARIIRENVTVTTGIGAEINNYRFDKNVKLISDSVPVFAAIEASKDYDKTKLVTGFLNVPLYLTFATNEFSNGKRIHVSPGITGGWRFTSYNKRVINENGDRNKSRNRDDFNLNPFRVNASLRIGYGSFVLFANYSLTDMFTKNEGPSITPFSLGVRVVGF